jgi:hypothetical protein
VRQDGNEVLDVVKSTYSERKHQTQLRFPGEYTQDPSEMALKMVDIHSNTTVPGQLAD